MVTGFHQRTCAEFEGNDDSLFAAKVNPGTWVNAVNAIAPYMDAAGLRDALAIMDEALHNMQMIKHLRSLIAGLHSLGDQEKLEHVDHIVQAELMHHRLFDQQILLFHRLGELKARYIGNVVRAGSVLQQFGDFVTPQADLSQPLLPGPPGLEPRPEKRILARPDAAPPLGLFSKSHVHLVSKLPPAEPPAGFPQEHAQQLQQQQRHQLHWSKAEHQTQRQQQHEGEEKEEEGELQRQQPLKQKQLQSEHRQNRGGLIRHDVCEYEDKSSLKTFTLSSSLQLLSSEDPNTLFIVRRIHKLGFKVSRKLRQHFSTFGCVRRVLVAHSTVKQHGDPAGALRRRPSSLGFVQMTSPHAVMAILAIGEEQVVEGNTIRVQKFERHACSTVTEEDVTAQGFQLESSPASLSDDSVRRATDRSTSASSVANGGHANGSEPDMSDVGEWYTCSF